MRKNSKIICFLITMSLFVACMAAMPAAAASKGGANGRLLIIVEDRAAFDASSVADYADGFDIIDSTDIDYKAISDYSNYAVPGTLAKTDKKLTKVLKTAFNRYNSRIYMYGEITISEFKNALDIRKFGADTDIYDTNGLTGKTAFLYFGKDQEDNTIENIISYSNSQSQKHLIATVYQDSDVFMEYMKIIIPDCCNQGIMPRAMIVKSGFNYRSYLSSSVFANMDFMLYRDMDESDPNYDYFAVKTNISTTGQSTARIEAEHRLPYSSDEMIDYGPGDITRAGSVSVGLDLGSGYGGGSVSYSFDVGGGPTIDASYYAADDYCTWAISRYWLFGGDLVNELFCLGSSWASTGTYAGIDVKFRAKFDVYADYFYSPWKSVQIRYDY